MKWARDAELMSGRNDIMHAHAGSCTVSCRPRLSSGLELGRYRRCARFCAVAFFLLALLSMIGSPVWAQSTQRHARRDPIEHALRNARQLIKQNQASRAVQQLEALLLKHPGDLRIIMLMGSAHTALGEYDKAADLYLGEIDRTGGRSIDLWIDLAGVYRRDGRGADAIEILLEALENHPAWGRLLTDPFELVATDSVGGEEAVAMLRDKALAPDAPATWREALAHVCIVTGAYTDALILLTDLDREKQASGTLVLQLAHVLAHRGSPEIALAALDSVLTLSPKPAIAEQSWYEKAEILQNLERPREAALAYEELAKRCSKGALAMQARMRHGALLMGPLRNLAAAQEVYTSILDELPRRSRQKALRNMRDHVLLALGECALRSGNFEEADSAFCRLEREANQVEMKEQAAYEHAEILFYQGLFREAEEAYYELTDHYQTGRWVNDALARALLLGDFGMTAGPMLEVFAHIQQYKRAGDWEAALELCTEALGDTTSGGLGGHLRLDQIQMSGRLGHWVQADSSLALMLEQESKSLLTPVALLWMAEQAATMADRRDLAFHYYEEVILRYPDSLEARRARAQRRVLLKADEQS
jgi:tetratricopeptide (TPR) repeat protein